MNRDLLRRAAPAVYALAILVTVLFAQDALLPVCIVGAVLLGMMYWLLPAQPGRDRQRRERRDRQRR